MKLLAVGTKGQIAVEVRSSSSLKKTLLKEVFVCEENDGWCRINLTPQWVSRDYLTF